MTSPAQPQPKSEPAEPIGFLDDVANFDLVRIIVKNAMGTPDEPKFPYQKAEMDRKWRRSAVRLCWVSTLFEECVTAELYSSCVPVVLSARELITLKRSAASLDLTREAPSLHKAFLKEIESTFGGLSFGEDFDSECSEYRQYWLPTFLDHYFDGSEAEFTKAAETEYKKLLVVKCIETLASDKGLGAERAAEWAERCQPTKIIDLFWHAHMLHPRAYASTCQHLLGAIIDHEPIYSLADRDTGRKDARVLTAKLDAIFGDKGQLGTYQWPDSRMLSKRAHDDITGEMVDSLMGYNDCG